MQTVIRLLAAADEFAVDLDFYILQYIKSCYMSAEGCFKTLVSGQTQPAEILILQRILWALVGSCFARAN